MFIADFHIHSKYSRATSLNCMPEQLDFWARRKGLHVIGTGDFTHAAWRAELKEKLAASEAGLYALKPAFRVDDPLLPGTERPRFIISGEISCIYKKGGKVRKVHNVIILPNLEAAGALSRRLEEIGNLHSDGRPILGLDSRDLLEIALDICEETIFIPAHIWTPHFSLFGAYSGFDDIRECFGDLTPHIKALETGLSSDPPMNWRLSALDSYTLVSNSDAHSPANLAREANIFTCELSYPAIACALDKRGQGGFYGTIEFFPEEGKYHYNGHRDCRVCSKPGADIICPVCGSELTVGVLHRVEAQADRAEGFIPENAPHFESLVPLPEVIAAASGHSAISIKGKKIYEDVLRGLGPELFVLREAELADIAHQVGPLLAEGIRRLRAGELSISPGYDGVYGKVSILDKSERERLLGQQHFFAGEGESPIRGRCPHRPAVITAAQPDPNSAAPAAPALLVTAPLESLNAEQQLAVTATQAALAVIAGPGTGKTKTLVARILHLLEQGVAPAQITAVTFTNKATQEMRERLAATLADKKTAKSLHIGTFHSICLRLLAQEGPPPALVDEAQAQAIMQQALANLGLKLGAREALRQVSLAKNGALPLSELPQGLYEAYQQQLGKLEAMDFDDILLKAEHIPYDPTHLLVDEFQDINPLQYRLVKAWAQSCQGLFVIGDPDQAIYGFRGAEPACFNWFFADFPEARRVDLVQNYRSTPQILRCAASVRPPQDAPSLVPMRADGMTVTLFTVPDSYAEARLIAREITRMVGGLDMQQSGRQPVARGFADIAVLYRANRQAEPIEDCLKKEGIPYTVSGREDFLTEPPVQKALAFLRGLPSHSHRRKPLKLLSDWLHETGQEENPSLQKLLHMAVLYDDLPTLLHSLTLGLDGDLRRSGSLRYKRDAVSLMTLHAAKGLEFPVVFLCGLSEGLLPLSSARATLAEEQRLFYVGLTRAKDELILTSGGKPSPFVAQLPLTEITVEKAKPAFKQEKLFR